MRYFNKLTKNEAIQPFHTIDENCVALSDTHAFWSPLPDDKEVTFDIDGLPLITDVVIDQVAVDKLNLLNDLNEALHDLTVDVNGKIFAISHESKYKYETIIKHMNAGETNGWTLANGTYDLSVTKEDLEEALRLGEIAGIELENAYHLAKSLL